MRALLPVVLTCSCLAGCARAGPIAQCDWPAEAPAALDLRDRAARRHLHDDALRAEDIAIRYADARKAPHSGHFEGFASYDRAMGSCMTTMLGVVGRTHGVSPAVVRESLAHRPAGPDAAVMASFAVLYGFVAYGVTRRVVRSFPLRGGWDSAAAVVAVVVTSMLASFVAMLVGEWYAIAAEMIRVGNGHLSFRTERIPWTHHRAGVFLAGVTLFWLVATLRYRIGVGSEIDHATLWAGRGPRRASRPRTS